MNLEETAQEYLKLKQERESTQEERANEVTKIGNSYDERTCKIDKSIEAITFNAQEVEAYLTSRGFERVDSLPWYLDVTKGVTRRLKKNPTYWREIETAEGKKKGIIFRRNKEGYELLSSRNNQRNSNVLDSDERRFGEQMAQMIASVGSMFLGLGLGIGGCAMRNPIMFLGGCAGVAYYAYIPIKICSFTKKQPRTEAAGNEAVLQLYQKFSLDSQGAPLSNN